MQNKPKPRLGSWISPDTLFTRQEIAERTGISDDVLSFWTKRGLLIAAEGGEGKGSHRRYAFHQVNVAALCGVFRDHFGANIATLSSLSDFLQSSIRLFERGSIHQNNWPAIAGLADDLAKFRSGEPVMVRVHDFDDHYERLSDEERLARRPATSEAEIVARYATSSDQPAQLSAIVKAAERIGPGHYLAARVAQSMLGSILDPYRFGNPSWLMRQTPLGWDILETNDGMSFEAPGDECFGPAVYIPVGSIFRKVWGYPHHGQLRNMAWAADGQRVLERMRVRGTVLPAQSDEDEGVYAYAYVSPKDRDVVEHELRREIVSFEFRDLSELPAEHS